MATTPPVAPAQIGILILDDDQATQGALRQVLDAEGWRVRFVPDGRALLAELATGEWSLVIASIALIGLDSSAFLMMKELSSAPVEEGGRVRALFLIPESGGEAFTKALDQLHMPYVARPFHLHDFLDKVSDLMVEIKAINAPIRQVRYEFGEFRKAKKQGARDTSMFPSRDSSVYTEEELAEYEKKEQEISNQRKKRKKALTDLGRPLP